MKKTPNTNTRECEKSVEVSDNFKTLRYKINFHTKTVISPNTYDIVPRYMVEVVNYVRDVPLVIYERMFDKHQDAMDDFERNVHNYQTFIQSQIQPLDDINLYKEKIGYVVQLPNCCLTCRFCRSSKDKRRLECHNYANFAFLETFGHHVGHLEDYHHHDKPNDHGKPCHDGCHCHHGHEKDVLPHGTMGHGEGFCHAHDDHHGHHGHFGPEFHGNCGNNPFLNIHPTVDSLGICKNFQQRPPQDRLVDPKYMHDLDREIYRQVVRSVDERMDCVNNSEYLVDCGDADYAIPERERMKEKLETFVETSVDRRLMEHAEAQNNFAINGGDADYTLPSQEKIKEKLENFVESTVDRRLIEHMNADREVGIDGGDSDGKEQ